MKLQVRQIESFLKNPDPAVKAVLVYGPDDGLMRERAQILAKHVVPDLSDPFLVATLSGEEISKDETRFYDEVHAIPMMGGRRLIRIKEPGEASAKIIQDYLDKPNDEALVLVEGPDLGPRSALRKLFEKNGKAAALPCYVDDERSIRQVIQQSLRHAGYLAERDAVDFLSQAISGDRMKIRQDIEKLILFMGPAKEYKGQEGPAMTRQLGTVTLEDAQKACGDTGARGVDDLVMSAGQGQGVKSVRIFETLMEEGTSVIWILRALMNHFRRLHEAKANIVSGLSASQAIDTLRPPVFFKQKQGFQKQLNSWSLEALGKILVDLNKLEAQSKSTGADERSMIGNYLLHVGKHY